MDAKEWRQWDVQFLKRVADCLRPFLAKSPSNLQPTPRKIVVGVSGGADSLVLLHSLIRILDAQSLIVAHVHHGLRAEADADADFVRHIAESWNLQFELKKIDVRQLAKDNGWTVEEAGRNVRYVFFAEVARKYGATAVSVAHNMDDQAETLLLHLIRGSGLTGLRGMQVVGQVPNVAEIVLLRPLLQTSRADIERYCQLHDLHPREDVSNQDTAYFRNQIRHELLPLLQTYNPQIKSNLHQLSQIVAADIDLLQAQFQIVWQALYLDGGDGWLKLSRQKWQELPLSQQRMALRTGILQIRPLQTDISFTTIELAHHLCKQNVSGTQMDLPGDVTLLVEYDSLIFATQPNAIPMDAPQIENEEPLSLPGIVALQNGWQLEAKMIASKDFSQLKENATELCVFVDVGDVSQLIVRGRLPGERMQPFGLNGQSAKIKEIMVNRKMIRPLRAHWPIVVTDEHPLWLVGHIIDHRVQIKENPRKIIQLRCFRQNDS